MPLPKKHPIPMTLRNSNQFSPFLVICRSSLACFVLPSVVCLFVYWINLLFRNVWEMHTRPNMHCDPGLRKTVVRGMVHACAAVVLMIPEFVLYSAAGIPGMIPRAHRHKHAHNIFELPVHCSCSEGAIMTFMKSNSAPSTCAPHPKGMCYPDTTANVVTRHMDWYGPPPFQPFLLSAEPRPKACIALCACSLACDLL